MAINVVVGMFFRVGTLLTSVYYRPTKKEVAKYRIVLHIV